MKKIEAQTSTPPKKRTRTHEAEIRKKMKYHKNPPSLTIIEDDTKFVIEKFQDKGGNALLAEESQREEIMENIT
jgi:hypothetical protein